MHNTIIKMKKIFFTLLLSNLAVYANDPKDGQPFQFGYIPEMKMWEKNADNLSNVISWEDFETLNSTEKLGVNFSDTYRFEDTSFLKLPGFGAIRVNGNKDDGTCLWSHLGVKPEKMFEIGMDIALSLHDALNQNPDLKEDAMFIAKVVEIINFLDPKEELIKENDSFNADSLALLIQDLDDVKKRWLAHVKKNGGTEFRHKGKSTAIRPLNSELFFEKLAEKLNIQIMIFSLPDSSNTLTLTRHVGDVKDSSKATLYLLDEGSLGQHYDILVPIGQPLSSAIYEELRFYNFTKNAMKNKKNKVNIGDEEDEGDEEKQPQMLEKDPYKTKKIKKNNKDKKDNKDKNGEENPYTTFDPLRWFTYDREDKKDGDALSNWSTDGVEGGLSRGQLSKQ